MIRLEHICRNYGKHDAVTPALRDISIQVPAGSFVTIVGTSGSGKTTLLNIIGGLDTSFDGLALIKDQNLKEMNDRDLSRFRSETVGFVFQHFNLLDHLDALQNVALGSFFSSGDTPGALARAEEVLVRVGLQDKLDQLPGQLSGGQKQRVAIARALFSRPAMILADEPTGNLDTQTGTQIISLFESLNQEDGLTVLVVTHEEFLFKNATHALHLEDGRLVEGDEE